MISHPELGSDSPIGSDRESGCDTRNQVSQIGKTIKRAIKLIKSFLSSHVDITPDPRSDTTLAYARLVKDWGGGGGGEGATDGFEIIGA